MEKQQPRRRPRTAAGRGNPESKSPDRRRPTPDGRYCVQRKIPLCVAAYNGKSLYAFLRTKENSYTRYCVQRKIPICVTAYKGNATAQTPTPDRRRPGKSPIQIPGPPDGRYCVQWKSLYALLRTMEIPICVTAYNGNPYMRYCVQWKIISPNVDTGPPQAKRNS